MANLFFEFPNAFNRDICVQHRYIFAVRILYGRLYYLKIQILRVDIHINIQSFHNVILKHFQHLVGAIGPVVDKYDF